IQMMHRLFALVVLAYMASLVLRLLRVPGMRGWAVLLALMTLGQIALGIANVLAGLPLYVAVAHNGGAALLLLVMVNLLARLAPLQQDD
ncbi:MAG: COX15/CtaA family protein, partial [Pseudomonadota bacterium]|nr:COX15/CtaA family protein [Pseudomonadota bacterium]